MRRNPQTEIGKGIVAGVLPSPYGEMILIAWIVICILKLLKFAFKCIFWGFSKLGFIFTIPLILVLSVLVTHYYNSYIGTWFFIGFYFLYFSWLLHRGIKFLIAKVTA